MKPFFKNPTKSIGLILIAILSVPYLYLTWQDTKADRNNAALQITRTLAATLDGRDIRKLEGKPDDIAKIEYKELKKKLQTIISIDKKVHFAYVYTVWNGNLYNLVDSEPTNSKYYTPPGIDTYEADSIYKQSFSNGKPLIKNTHSEIFGDWVSVFVPIKNPATHKPIAVFAMDYDPKYWALPILIDVAKSLLIIILTLSLFLFFIRIKDRNKKLNEELEKRKQADTKFAASENKLNEVLRISQDIFYKCSLDGIILEISKTVEIFTDYKTEDLIGTDVSTLYSDKKDREILIAILKEKGKVTDYKITMRAKNGSKKYFLLNSTLIFDHNNQPLYIEGAMKDITERKKAKQKLIDSENFLKAIIDNQPECIKIVDENGKLLMMNPSGLQMIQANSFEQVDGVNVVDLITKEHKTNFLKLHKEVIEGGTRKLEFEIKGIKGGRRWLETFAAPMNLNGKVVHIAHTRDITERKKTEKLLIENEQFLKESQEIGRIGSYDFNINSGNWYYSNVMDELFGIDKAFERNLEGWKTIIHPDWVKTMEDYLQDDVVNKRNGFDKEYKIIRKNDDAVRWVHGLGKLQFDAAGNPCNLVGVIQDVTQQKELEEELNQAKNKAEESDRLKSAFLANMSHEIRTPMNGILGFADLLKEPELSPEKQAEYIDIIRKSGTRMLNIINDIIDVSKIESGLMQVRFGNTNINKKIKFIHSFFKVEANKNGIELNCYTELADDQATINSDKEKLLNILTNLVKNAIKFTPKGRIDFGYHVKNSDANPSEKVFEFYVKDTGKGIDEEHLNLVFERFRQTDERTAKNHEGAGLGLAITKSFVEMLGGKIWVESEVGKGSIFYFTIPYNPTQIAEEIVATSASSNDKTFTKDLKILFAEDDEISAKLLGLSINAISKSALRARNGEEAVELARNNPDIDLILMDIQMPKMDGYQATVEIRKFNPDVIIIAQSAFAFIEDIDRAKDAGCNDHLSKPVKKSELLQMVNKYFGD